MSLAFLGMDDSPGLCPSCSGNANLVYDTFGKLISCDACLLLKKGYAERVRKEEEAQHAKRDKALKEIALELGRNRLERMKNG